MSGSAPQTAGEATVPPQPFTPEVVTAVTAHMNGDHPEDTLLICRALGGRPDATAARMTGLDGEGGDYAVTVDGTEEDVRIPWAAPLTERAQIRVEVVRMYQEACAALGVTPRGEH
ncbi:DUF2470 domain-containing protein [Nocardiopsis sp. SBT366]|uniref:DUF2470 domain-containing protein n=1 Tax=Nocardiopsis sp. SBT366 TaxID=1580529 RepID=UPI00066A69C0|nr:DUF2470 domain-containing protein [Nocardiopsis sp. SBT366]